MAARHSASTLTLRDNAVGKSKLPSIPGLNPEQVESLRLIMLLKPWQSTGIGAKVGQFLDGDSSALAQAPVLRAKVRKAARIIRRAARR